MKAWGLRADDRQMQDSSSSSASHSSESLAQSSSLPSDGGQIIDSSVSPQSYDMQFAPLQGQEEPQPTFAKQSRTTSRSSHIGCQTSRHPHRHHHHRVSMSMVRHISRLPRQATLRSRTPNCSMTSTQKTIMRLKSVSWSPRRRLGIISARSSPQ